MSKKIDITSRKDVELFVNKFYDKVNADELLSPIFNDLKQVNWKTHLPIMYRFWESILLGAGTYNGSPFPLHLNLPVTEAHFTRWVLLFEENMNELFEGPTADEAKHRAKSIANIFWNKIKMVKGSQ